MTSTTQEAQEISDVIRLCHDLRQYIAAGRLVADRSLEAGAADTADLGHRLDTMAEILAAMEDIVRAHLEDRLWVIDLCQVVHDCVRVARITSEAAIQAEVEGPAYAYAQPGMMRRAVLNVLSNAARAAGRQGHVEVRIHRQAFENWIEVADSGPGFARIDTATGHGLSIVDQALRAASGSLEITSDPGSGTTVRLRLPARLDGVG